MPNNAEAIASALVKSGVEFAFGLPGGEVVALIDALRRAGIRFFLTGHEASAAFMADVTGQISGRVGVCIATLGPGAVNLSLGLANALLDRSPVLAITAQVSTRVEAHFPHQRLPLQRFFSSICKSSLVLDGRATMDVVEQCLRLAETPPYGPVHIALPSDLASTATSDGLREASVLGGTPPSQSPALRDIAAMLNEARSPLLVVGVGCSPRDAPALRRFADATRLPFVVTPKAKGLLPEDAPGFLGVVGGMALDREVMATVDTADVLLGIGFDPVECDKAWYVERKIASISRWPTGEGKYRPVEFVGDITRALVSLQENVSLSVWPEHVLEACKARMRASPQSPQNGSPLAALRALRTALPRDTVLTCDVGSHKYFAGQFWQSFEPQTFFMSNGLSAMGYGVPAAIAAKLQFRDRPVIALAGDGGLLMMLHNLVFLRQYNVPVVILCFVDESHSLIRLGQQRRGLEPYGVDFPAPDFARVAKGFGIKGFTVRSISQLTRKVEAALEDREPAVISFPISTSDYEAYA